MKRVALVCLVLMSMVIYATGKVYYYYYFFFKQSVDISKPSMVSHNRCMIQINVKKIASGNKKKKKKKKHHGLENGSLGFIETLHKQ